MAEICHLENRHDVIFFGWGWSDLDKISQTHAEWHVDCGDIGLWSKSKTDVEFQYGGRLGEFNGTSSQSHVSHCGVLPLGEFTVMFPEPHATLQGVRIPSPILKIVFRHILFYFCFLMQFGLWRAAAFVSSSIHLFNSERFYTAKKNGPSETVRSNMSKLHNFKKRSVKWDVAVLFRLKWLFCCYWIQNCSENIFI